MLTYEWVTSHFSSPGYFVEAGAHDGVGDSQTYQLEQAGWTGICAEPSTAFVGLKRSRKCHVSNCCLWKEDKANIDFWQVPGNSIELSGIQECFRDHWDRSQGGNLQREAVTLSTLLRRYDAPPIIEFFSLDTEGSEYEILSAHDFEAYHFLSIIVEHNSVSEQQARVRELLIGHGYQLDQSDGTNDWYLAAEVGANP